MFFFFYLHYGLGHWDLLASLTRRCILFWCYSTLEEKFGNMTKPLTTFGGKFPIIEKSSPLISNPLAHSNPLGLERPISRGCFYLAPSLIESPFSPCFLLFPFSLVSCKQLEKYFLTFLPYFLFSYGKNGSSLRRLF